MKRNLVFAGLLLLAGCGAADGAGSPAGANALSGDLAFTLASVAPGSGGGSDGSCDHDSILTIFSDTCEGGANGKELRITEDFTRGGTAQAGTFDIAAFDCGAGSPVGSVHYTAFYTDGGADFFDAISGKVTIDAIGTAVGGYPSMKGSYQATFESGEAVSGTFDTTNADGCL